MSDTGILRELAKRYAEISAPERQEPKRKLWREHNSLRKGAIPIYVRAFGWHEMPQSRLECSSPLFKETENFLRESLFRHAFEDDFIFEPYITVGAVHKCSGWGVSGKRNFSEEVPHGAYKEEYPLKEFSDIEKLVLPRHEIDELATAQRRERLQEAVGDIVEVNLDRGPAYRMWTADISTDLGHLRGIENIMVDMMDNPEWLRRLCSFMRDGILRAQEQAEAAGDWGLCAHQNQAMPYSLETKDPAANANGSKRSELWGYMASQEFTAVSPAMFDEFLLQYQMPIIEKFAILAYGCCEDLTNKISVLRRIPNLRRIAVSPFANVRKCAEQIGRDYVLSYRPSPSDMVGYGFDPDRIEKILGRDLALCKDCVMDITLKDVETVEADPDRVRKWVRLVRQICKRFE